MKRALFILAAVALAACSSPTAPLPKIQRTDKTPSTIANHPTIQPEGR